MHRLSSHFYISHLLIKGPFISRFSWCIATVVHLIKWLTSSKLRSSQRLNSCAQAAFDQFRGPELAPGAEVMIVTGANDDDDSDSDDYDDNYEEGNGNC